jgi:hypothetical protein
MNTDDILTIIADEARQADERAAVACERSKYSIQDYHLCIEFYLQRLHDRIAAESGSDRRCPQFPFRRRVADFRESLCANKEINQ